VAVSRIFMKEHKVSIPEEKYSVIQFIQEDLPGVGIVNSALVDFKPKEVFAWHLSVMIEFEDLVEKGMPSHSEREIVDPFGEQLDNIIKGSDPTKPNALFLARLTWNGTRELIWRVYDPEVINTDLQLVIESGSAPREFDYRMEEDEEWILAQWHLKSCKK